MKRLVTALALGLVAAACSQGPPPEPPPPPPLNPVGVYNVTIDAQGTQMGGSLTINGEAGAYTGSIETDLGGAPLSEIEVAGQEVTFLIDIPEASLAFTLTFEDDSFTGEFDGSMGYGTISGTKRE